MTSPDPLAQIRARAVAATAGPWEHFPITGKTNGLRIGGKAGYAELDPYDASFAANAREDVPALLAALDAVLALHRPMVYAYDTPEGTKGVQVCSCCQDWVHDDAHVITYPCSTVAAVSAALGGEE